MFRTDYFPREEFEQLVDATYLLAGAAQAPDLFGETPQRRKAISAVRLRTLMLLMRWSGLRIGDAVTLERSRLIGDSLLLCQAKTGEPVYVPLPSEVAENLREIPPGNIPNPRYFFWNGRCAISTAVKYWEDAFRELFKIADIRKPDGTAKWCHSHMLRDTFAIELLLAGVPIDQVSRLLGHSSIKTTEKHYAPWVRARQEQLENSVRQAHLVQGITKSARKADPAKRTKRSNVTKDAPKPANLQFEEHAIRCAPCRDWSNSKTGSRVCDEGHRLLTPPAQPPGKKAA